MKLFVKQAITIILAAVTVASVGAVLTGCGKDKKNTDPTSATVAATTAATTAATVSSATAVEQQISDATQAQADNSDQDHNDADGYIDEATAIANVKQQAGSGARIISSEKGYTPDGLKAWVIVVAPVTTADGPETVTYYSGYQFCYPETSYRDADTGSKTDEDGYIDEATAIANVKQQAGSGARIISSEKGYTPDGLKAWVIVVAPVTTADGPETVTYYSGYQFCYK